MRSRSDSALRVPFLLALTACGAAAQGPSSGGTKPAHDETCVQVAASARAFEPPSAPPPREGSALIAELGVELAPVRARLEREVPKRLGQGTNEPIGAPGKLTYAVDRGAFTIAVRGDDVVLRMPFSATASVCKPSGLLGCVTYGRCAPAGVVEAKIAGRLGETWSLGPARADVIITKRCVMTALEVDVTPQLESRARAEVKKAEQKINAALPNPRPVAEDAWRKLQAPVPLGDACLILEPKSVTQGPPKVVDDVLVTRVRVDASPTLRAPCPAAPEPTPLPKLAQAPELPSAFGLHLAVAEGSAQVDAQVSASLTDVRGGALRVTSARARSAKEGLVLDADVVGPSCGTVRFVADVAWDPKRRAVVASAVRPMDGEQARLGAAVDLAALGKAIGARLAIGLPFDDEAIERNLADAAKLAADGPVTVSITVRERASEGLFLLGDGLEGRFRAEGTARAIGREIPDKKR
jgi:hypothetical protein